MQEFFSDHPLVWQLAIFPLVTALFTWLLKPRTPEDYAALNPRVAAALKFVGAVGFDLPEILEAVKQFATGRARTPEQERAKGDPAPLGDATRKSITVRPGPMP